MTEEEKVLKLAKASVMNSAYPGMDMWGSNRGKDSIDKFSFPDDFYDIIDICRHYYRTDPLVSTTIDKIISVGFKDYYIQRRECTDEEFNVYNSFSDSIKFHLRQVGLEYLLSGLIIPEVSWVSKPGKEIDPKLDNKPYIVPDTLWYRDPSTIELKSTPIPGRLNAYVKVTDEEAYFIRNKGVYPDGTKDVETYQLLLENYPEFVKSVKAGERKFHLDNPHIIRRNPLPDTPYPTPYLMAALEPLEHKRNLLKMDYAIASRVISAIMLITLGSDEYPLTEDDEDQVEALKAQMRFRGRSGLEERMFQLFGNHTLNIKWIMPDVSALLDNKKYESVNNDIMSALGFPRILITGETTKSATSSAEFALISPAESIKSIRQSVLSWPEKIYRETMKRNGFDNLPNPNFSEIRLYDLSKVITISDILYQRGVISKSTFAQLGGFDYESTELPARAREKELLEEYGLDEFPAQPFTPQAGGQDLENNDEDTDNGNEDD